MKIDKNLWNSNLNAFELALLFDCCPGTVRNFARANNLQYVQLKMDGKRAKNSWDLPDRTEQQIAVRKLIKEWRMGDDGAGKELGNYGIRAMRCG